MANIFTYAKNFVRDTLKQAATIDNLRDYAHANRLFVGSDFRLVPKHGSLFHVFFDINPNSTIANDIVRQDPNRIELGLMVKSVGLPRYDIATKKINAYNRQNLVQTHINYDDITIKFHDDSANIVRNFWYDYYRYYYRSSDYTESVYRQNYKYRPQDRGAYGYSPRAELNGETLEPYLTSVRIYSLHQKRFSEYILINPLIRNFRHGSHSNMESNLLDHDMVIEYENILYQAGDVTSGGVKGFAQLHYDTRPSPLRQGGVKTIFGSGGLLDSATSIFGVLANPNAGATDYINAAFLAARTINTARSMNLKKAALGELTSYYTQQTSKIINDTVQSKYSVPNLQSSPDAGNKQNGISTVTSAAFTVGAAVILNSTSSSNRYQSTPLTQASTASTAPPSNYNPGLPKLFNAATTTTVDPTATLNNQTSAPTNQIVVDTVQQRAELDGQISGLNTRLGQVTGELALAQNQVTATTQAIAELSGRLATVQASTPVGAEAILTRSRLITDLQAQIAEKTKLKTTAENEVTVKQSMITSLNNQINNFTTRRGRLG